MNKKEFINKIDKINKFGNGYFFISYAVLFIIFVLIGLYIGYFSISDFLLGLLCFLNYNESCSLNNSTYFILSIIIFFLSIEIIKLRILLFLNFKEYLKENGYSELLFCDFYHKENRNIKFYKVFYKKENINFEEYENFCKKFNTDKNFIEYLKEVSIKRYFLYGFVLMIGIYILYFLYNL